MSYFPEDPNDQIGGMRGIVFALLLCLPLWIAFAVVIYEWNR